MDNGNTLPFIARYHKEKTGSLDEDQLRIIGELLGRLRALDERRESVLAAIAEQGKLTPQLEAEIRAAATETIRWTQARFIQRATGWPRPC
jgi:uncharacterized protein